MEQGILIVDAHLDLSYNALEYSRNLRLPVPEIRKIIDHYDHICQIAGNSLHIAIGSDLDGGYGKEQSPYDLETIADLQLLRGLLEKRGYGQQDIENIFHGNWLRFLKKAWESET